MKKTVRCNGGFTLIEIMIVVVIVAILAGIALPAYVGYVERANRTDAKTALMNAVQALERCYTVHFRYDHDECEDLLPVDSQDGHYVIDFATDEPTENTFLIEAVPVSGGRQDGDDCGTFRVSHTGLRTVANASLDADECWGR